MKEIDIRCPVGPRRLFSKVIIAGETPKRTDGNLVEFSCDDCKRSLRKRGVRVFRVLHRYNLAGDLVLSLIQEDIDDSRDERALPPTERK